MDQTDSAGAGKARGVASTSSSPLRAKHMLTRSRARSAKARKEGEEYGLTSKAEASGSDQGKRKRGVVQLNTSSPCSRQSSADGSLSGGSGADGAAPGVAAGPERTKAEAGQGCDGRERSRTPSTAGKARAKYKGKDKDKGKENGLCSAQETDASPVRAQVPAGGRDVKAEPLQPRLSRPVRSCRLLSTGGSFTAAGAGAAAAAARAGPEEPGLPETGAASLAAPGHRAAPPLPAPSTSSQAHVAPEDEVEGIAPAEDGVLSTRAEALERQVSNPAPALVAAGAAQTDNPPAQDSVAQGGMAVLRAQGEGGGGGGAVVSQAEEEEEEEEEPPPPQGSSSRRGKPHRPRRRDGSPVAEGRGKEESLQAWGAAGTGTPQPSSDAGPETQSQSQSQSQSLPFIPLGGAQASLRVYKRLRRTGGASAGTGGFAGGSRTTFLDLPQELVFGMLRHISYLAPGGFQQSLVCRAWARMAPTAQECLRLPAGGEMREEAVCVALTQLPNLTWLHFPEGSVERISDRFLQRLAGTCRLLRHLVVEPKACRLDCAFTTAGLSAFFQAGLPLQSLQLCDRNGVPLHLPASVACLQGLSSLQLGSFPAEEEDPEHSGGMRLARSLTRSLSALTGLKELVVGGEDALEDLPAGAGSLRGLRRLSLSLGQRVASRHGPPRLMASLGWLTALRRLHLRAQNVLELPATVGQLRRLQVLEMDTRWLRALPEELGQLTSLEEVRVKSISLRELPLGLWFLPRLWFLHLDCVSLAGVPDLVTNLVALESLTVKSSFRSSTPESLAGLGRLSALELGLGMSAQPPEGLSPEGTPALRQLSLAMGMNTGLDPGVCRLRELQQLHVLHWSFLAQLPREIGALSGLTELRVDRCPMIAELPKAVTSLPRLLILTLQGNTGLTRLPEDLGALSSLVILCVRGSPLLASLPESLGDLAGLTHLHIEDCSGLRSLPSSMGRLGQLTHLTLQSLLLKRLPGTLAACGPPDGATRVPASSLHSPHAEDASAAGAGTGVVVSKRKVGKRHSKKKRKGGGELEVTGLRSLRHLHIESCHNLVALPWNLGCLSALEILELNYLCRLESLPKGFGHLRALHTLRIAGAPLLQALPDNLGSLLALERLALVSCPSLQRLPESFGRLEQLRELILQGMRQLRSIPKSLTQLVRLRKLQLLDLPRVQTLPREVGRLRSLRGLMLQELGVRALPESMLELTELQDLVVVQCPKLVAFPHGLLALPRLSNESRLIVLGLVFRMFQVVTLGGLMR